MSQQQAPPTDTRFSDQLIFAGLGLAAVASGWLWLTGEAAGLVFHRQRPRVGLTELGPVLVRLPRHLGDPKLAFPGHAQPVLPGPVGFYVVMALVAAALSFAAAYLWGLIRGRSSGGPRSPGRGLRGRRRGRRSLLVESSWATAGSLKPLLHPPGKGRVTVAHRGRQPVTTEPGQSTIVVAPQQVGKTTTVVMRALLQRRRGDGPTVVIVAKPNVLQTLPHLRTLGEVFVFDPTAGSGLGSCSWTPLTYCRTYAQARTMAAWLIHAARPTGARDDEESVLWERLAVKLLGPTLYAAANSDGGIDLVLRWLHRNDEDGEVANLLEKLACDTGFEDQDGAVLASDEHLFVFEKEPRQRDSIAMSAVSALDAFVDPTVARHTARDTIGVDRLLKGDNTLVIYAPAHDQARLRPLVEALLGQVFRTAVEMAAAGRPVPGRLLAILDDAFGVASPAELPELIATGTESHLQFLTVWQDLSQLLQRYGKAATSIFSNHRAKLFLGGQSDDYTLEILARLIGSASISQLQHTIGGDGHHSVTHGETQRQLAAADVLRQIPDRIGLLVYGNLPPAILDAVPWFDDPALRKTVSGPRHAVRR